MVRESHFESSDDLRRYETLLQMADIMVRHSTLPELFHELAGRLHEVIAFDVASLSLYVPEENVMRLHVWEGTEPARAPATIPIDLSPGGWVWKHQQALVVGEIEKDDRFESFRRIIASKGIRSYCALPLTVDDRHLGALGLGSSRPVTYGENDVRFLQRVAELASLVLDAVMTRSTLQRQTERQETLLQVNTHLFSNLGAEGLLPAIVDFLEKVLRPDFAALRMYEAKSQTLQFVALSPLSEEFRARHSTVKIKRAIDRAVLLRGDVQFLRGGAWATAECPLTAYLRDNGIRSHCILPLIAGKGTLGTLHLGSKEESAIKPRDTAFLKHVAAQVAAAWENAQAYREIAELTEMLKTEKLYLEDEIRLVTNFEEIVGESPALKKVLHQVNTVAPSDATVLILGETGTGKELVARAIHRMSARKDASFIKLNCAAIPTGLLESELFGHEKGAFTGAVSQKIGRLELADRGTLFLDEVGEIPLELQPKLLRVLQDQEFERLGGTRTIKVDIRLVAATNRDLVKSMAQNMFRSDLYYRLHVFPVQMPALRERAADIPLLVRYFVQKFARNMNKPIGIIPREAMDALTGWHWPGNVRELENLVERSVILSDGAVLRVPLSELRLTPGSSPQGSVLESLEREHILKVLRETGGVIAGVNGAAARLGMKRTTLQSRIQKMGITRQEYQN